MGDISNRWYFMEQWKIMPATYCKIHHFGGARSLVTWWLGDSVTNDFERGCRANMGRVVFWYIILYHKVVFRKHEVEVFHKLLWNVQTFVLFNLQCFNHHIITIKVVFHKHEVVIEKHWRFSLLGNGGVASVKSTGGDFIPSTVFFPSCAVSNTCWKPPK